MAQARPVLQTGRSLAVLVHEGLHVVPQALDALHGHAVVERGAAAADRAVAGERVELVLLGLLQELLLHCLVAAHDGERRVHAGTAVLLDRAAVEAVGAVDGVVDQPALLVGQLVPVRDAAHLLGVLEVLAHGVQREARGRVVHGAGISAGLPAHVRRADLQLVLAAGKIIADDAHGDARGADVLLQPGVDVGVLAHLDGLGAEVGGHVGHQGHIADLRRVLPLHAVHGLVGAVVDVRGCGVQLPGARVRDGRVLGRLGVAGALADAVLGRLLHGLVAPDPGDQVVDLGLRRAGHVQRHGRELQRRSALHENGLVLGGHVEDLAEVGLGLVGDGGELLAPVRHLHDAHAAALPVHHVLLDLLEHLQRHHAGAGGEVVHAVGGGHDA
mmetsp:Transcript_16646/g.22915  ORF Transcript_16646/g.22915 Transcript_16646/m.22915 type:complete len:386 (-) Transcript_16646:77-1234(-)